MYKLVRIENNQLQSMLFPMPIIYRIGRSTKEGIGPLMAFDGIDDADRFAIRQIRLGGPRKLAVLRGSGTISSKNGREVLDLNKIGSYPFKISVEMFWKSFFLSRFSIPPPRGTIMLSEFRPKEIVAHYHHVFKVVRREGESYSSSATNGIQYRIGQKTVPKRDKIFAFRNRRSAIKYGQAASQRGFNVLVCIARVSNRRSEALWHTIRAWTSKTCPQIEGAMLCDMVFPIRRIDVDI